MQPEGVLALETPWRRWDVTTILWAGLALVLVALVANPLLRLLWTSFEGPGGAFTLGNYVQAFSRPRYLLGFRNSLVLGFSVACLCLLFAVPMAWGVSRTNMPAKNLIQLLVLSTFVTPPFLGATSWILLAGPNAGWLNRAFMGIFGTESGILNIYSFPGVVFVIAIYSFPYSFVFTKAALDLVSSEMEDAANCLGAGRLKTTAAITLPLIMPALLGAWIITFLEAMAIIGSSVIVALPAIGPGPWLTLTIAGLTASLNVEGHRSDLVILKAARAHAAYEGRMAINERDIALAAELALPHRIKHGPFHQAEISPEQLQERIEQLQGSAADGEPSETKDKEPEAESVKKKS